MTLLATDASGLPGLTGARPPRPVARSAVDALDADRSGPTTEIVPTETMPMSPDALLAAPGRHASIPRMTPRVARTAVLAALRLVEGGTIDLHERDRVHHFRARDHDRYGRPALHAVVSIHDPRAYVAIATRGSSGLGEAYRRGWFDADDLTSLLRLLSRAMRRVEPARLRLRWATGPIGDAVRRLRRASTQRDRHNVAAHYDLGNAFFELFLDDTLTYSAGLFVDREMPMEDASIAKLDRLCRRLDLRPGQRVVEIGTGWGSFALHAATHYGVEVVTTTLSAQQQLVARQRVAAAGLSDRIDVRLEHYRQLRGTFDAAVAIEMIEAVDWRELDDFIGRCASLVGPTGAVALQAIVSAPHRHSLARSSHDFVKTHIFPGGSVPSVPSILGSAAKRTDLIPSDLIDFGPHYAETLRRWATALDDHHDDALALGLGEEFLRLWRFYLSYCEAGFDERQISVAQLILERPGRSRSLR